MRKAHTELPGNRPLRSAAGRVERTDLCDLSGAELSHSVVLAGRLSATALRVPVADVVGVRPEEQVVRANARRIIASVADAQPFRDISEVDHPGKAVCLDCPPLEVQSAVALFQDGSGPEPAAIGFPNALPKAAGTIVPHRNKLHCGAAPRDGYRRRWGIPIVLALAAGSSGCSSLWNSVKSSAAPAAGAGTGAFVGSLAPPFGPVIGAALGAVIMHSVAENAALRSGETVGEEALEKELNRLKSRVIHAESGLATTSSALRAAEAGKEWLSTLIRLLMAGGILWFLWRNRGHIRSLGLFNGLKHSVCGGQVGKREAVIGIRKVP